MTKEIFKFPGKKILVVEDYSLSQEMMQDMLESMECIVEFAENGEEAIEKFRTSNYDLILMDIQMPKKDGYETTRAIRALEKDKHTPIIALTASALIGDREKCLAAQMDDYLSKPIDKISLGNKLKTFFK